MRIGMRTLALVVLIAGLSGNAFASGMEKLNQFVATMQTMQGAFDQRIQDRNGKLIQESNGTLAFARPGKFRWVYNKPYVQIIVGDGAKVWIYDEDLLQVTVRKLDQALGSTPAALLAGSNEMLREFALKDEGMRDGLDWVEAVPRNKDSNFERIRIGFGAAGLAAMELTDAFGQITWLRFKNLQRNPRLDAALFHFTPPKDADVVGDK